METAPIVLGRLTLRTLPESAAGGPYLQWMQDPEIVRYLEARFTALGRDGLAEYIRFMNADPDVALLGIFVTETDEHIGNIKLGPIDRNHRVGDVGLLVGAKAHWGKGYATEAIAGLTAWALETLGLHKLTAACYDVNERSRRAFLKAGWVEEGRLREQYESEGKRVDRVLLAYIRGTRA
jgi:ribosomal-protein-alanine N-acetyltransferase